MSSFPQWSNCCCPPAQSERQTPFSCLRLQVLPAAWETVRNNPRRLLRRVWLADLDPESAASSPLPTSSGVRHLAARRAHCLSSSKQLSARANLPPSKVHA